MSTIISNINTLYVVARPVFKRGGNVELNMIPIIAWKITDRSESDSNDFSALGGSTLTWQYAALPILIDGEYFDYEQPYAVANKHTEEWFVASGPSGKGFGKLEKYWQDKESDNDRQADLLGRFAE